MREVCLETLLTGRVVKSSSFLDLDVTVRLVKLFVLQKRKAGVRFSLRPSTVHLSLCILMICVFPLQIIWNYFRTRSESYFFLVSSVPKQPPGMRFVLAYFCEMNKSLNEGPNNKPGLPRPLSFLCGIAAYFTSQTFFSL